MNRGGTGLEYEYSDLMAARTSTCCCYYCSSKCTYYCTCEESLQRQTVRLCPHARAVQWPGADLGWPGALTIVDMCHWRWRVERCPDCIFCIRAIEAAACQQDGRRMMHRIAIRTSRPRRLLCLDELASGEAPSIYRLRVLGAVCSTRNVH